MQEYIDTKVEEALVRLFDKWQAALDEAFGTAQPCSYPLPDWVYDLPPRIDRG